MILETGDRGDGYRSDADRTKVSRAELRSREVAPGEDCATHHPEYPFQY